MIEESRSVLAEARANETAGERQLMRGSGRCFAFAVGAVALVFAAPLAQLTAFSISSPVYSYIVLIPLITIYVAWSSRSRWSSGTQPNRPLAVAVSVLGIAVFVASLLSRLMGTTTTPEDWLAGATLAFVLTLTGTCGWFLARDTWRQLRFAFAFLIFMIPLPSLVLHHVETLMQHGSAMVSHVLFRLAGTSVFYQNLHFQLPGITLHVAPECSGIRSTLVLFIVSVLTGHFFLRTVTGAVVLSVAVIPLALLRNGFRIFTIGELCTHIGPHMIDSPIHHQGGPIFFILSLGPFFLTMFAIMKLEQRPWRSKLKL